MNPIINPQQIIAMRMGAIPNVSAVPYGDLGNISSIQPQFEDEGVQITLPEAGTDARGQQLPPQPLPPILARARQARQILLEKARVNRKTAWREMMKEIGIVENKDVFGGEDLKLPEAPPEKPKRVIGYRGMLNEPIYEDNSKPYSTMQVAADGEESPTSPQSYKTAEELPKIETLWQPNNKVDSPYRGKFEVGKRYVDGIGDDPYIYETQYVDPKSLLENLNMEGNTYDGVVNMPTTQKYIEWYKQGEVPPPIGIVKHMDTAKNVSTNRRRIIAAIEAGVDKIPAYVEIGRKSQLTAEWENANRQPSPLHAEALKYKSAEEFVKSKGKPLYHGTDSEFDSFSEKKMGMRDPGEGGMLGDGFYATGQKAYAKQYGKNVKEVYFDLKNPLVMDDFYIFGGIHPDKIRIKLGLPVKATSADVRKELIKQGYDGIIINEVRDEGTRKNREVVALDKSQIKTTSDLTRIWNEAQSQLTSELDKEQGKDKDTGGDIYSHRNAIASDAQEIVDSWVQDEDGVDEEYGCGGVCDEISSKIGERLAQDGYDIVDGSTEGDDHAYIYAVKNGRAFIVDIPPHVYESGGGYSWKKKPGASIKPSDVFIKEIPLNDIKDLLNDN